MKYTLELTLDLPLDRVIELFDSSENLSKWQPGLKTFEPLSGEPGQAGAKSRLVYDENGRRIEMVETIIKRDLPDEFSALFEAKGVKNWTTNRFYADGPEKTRWVMDNEFKLSGLMALMGIFMRGTFPKETMKHMNQFKTFAESA